MLCAGYDDKMLKFLNWKDHFPDIFVRVIKIEMKTIVNLGF